MDETIYWARTDDLNTVVAMLPHHGEALMILERVPTTWLDEDERKEGLCFQQFDGDVDFNMWERGRIFCPTFELRWDRVDGAFQVVYVGEGADLPGLQPASEVNLSVLSVEERAYYLWGERVDDDDLPRIGQPNGTDVFVELQVPRLLRYPVSEQTRRVKLRVREYKEPATGQLVCHRFHSLEKENQGESHESL